MKRTRNGVRVIGPVIQRLKTAYSPQQIILFGSYATGHPTRESDLDLLIVKETSKPFHQRLFEVRRLVSPVLHGYPFDPIVVTPKELKRRLARGDQFLQEIMAKGKRVYAGA
jgi:predicted nucleotidyltransferase